MYKIAFTVFTLLLVWLSPIAQVRAQDSPQVRIVEVRRQSILKAIEELPTEGQSGAFSVLRYQDNLHGSRTGWPEGTYRRTVTYYYTPAERNGQDRVVYCEEEQEKAGKLQYWTYLFSARGDLQYARYSVDGEATVLYYDARGDLTRYEQNGEEVVAPSLWVQRGLIESHSQASKDLFHLLRKAQ